MAAGAAASNRQAKKQASLMATASVGCLRNAAKEDTRRLSLGKDSLKHAKGVRCCSAYHANIHKSPGAVSPKREDRVSFSELVSEEPCVSYFLPYFCILRWWLQLE